MNKLDSPLYFKVDGDERIHFNNNLAQELRQTVPDYWDDVCPACGNTEKIMGCRCYISHRTCPFCKTTWRWDLDRQNAKMCVIIESKGK